MEKNNTRSVRFEYIDICKAIAIFAMVFCHVGMRMKVVDLDLDRQIHLWHMPIFFILSGIVLNSSKWIGWRNLNGFVKNRGKKIILPYLIYGGVINLYLYFASNYVIKGDKILTLRDCLLSSFDFTLSTITAFGWFLPALFLTELAFVILSNILGTNKKLFGFYIFIVMLGMHLGAFFIMKLPLALYVLPFTLGFFAFGFLFKNVIANARYKQKSISLLLALFVICWYFIPVIVNVRTSIYNPLYVSWFVCLLVSLAIIVLVHHFESRIVNCYSYKWVKFLGRNTLLIYLLHNEFIRILPLKKICIDSVSLSTMVQLLVTLGILCLLWFVIRFINKHLAWTIGNF